MDSVSYTPLTPLSFLERSARVWPDKTAVIYGRRRLTYAELAAETTQAARALRGGWFHSGDLGVMYPDGYIELRDRAKDIVISGGENISTIEVEQALMSHPCVLETAVVGVPDEQWGERPKAFVVLRAGTSVTPEALMAHVRRKIARYKAPREIDITVTLPKTPTGKIQKFLLRDAEWSGHQNRIHG